MKSPLSIFMLLLLFSCSNVEQEAYDSVETNNEYRDYTAAPEADHTATASQASKHTPSSLAEPRSPMPEYAMKIIKSAQLSMEVASIQEFDRQLQLDLAFHEAYLASANFQSGAYQNQATYTIHVPKAKYSDLLAHLVTQSDSILHKRESAVDVTEEFVDLKSRLQTKKEVRDRYQHILRKKAQTVEDVLAAEEAIRQLTEEIEAKEGRLRYLGQKSAWSTISLDVREPFVPVVVASAPAFPFLTQLQQQFVQGAGLLKGILLSLVRIWPLLLLVALIVWRRKSLVRRFRVLKS